MDIQELKRRIEEELSKKNCKDKIKYKKKYRNILDNAVSDFDLSRKLELLCDEIGGNK